MVGSLTQLRQVPARRHLAGKPITLIIALWLLACDTQRGDVLTRVGRTQTPDPSIPGDSTTASLEAGVANPDGPDSLAPDSGDVDTTGNVDATSIPPETLPPSVIDSGEDEGVTPIPPDVVLGASYYTACASIDGVLYCWGLNDAGQLGNGTTDSERSPVRIDDAPAFRQLDGGERYMCGLDLEGTLYCWGSNASGQLGQDDRQDRRVPTVVPLPEPASYFVAGSAHVCALVESGALYCWGANAEGQLGLDDPYPGNNSPDADGLTPAVVGTQTWTSIATGQGHSCGTLADGSLWCWGRNSDLQLSDTASVQYRAPLRIGTGTSWTGAVAGQTHSCGIQSDASLWCWGSDSGDNQDLGYPVGLDDSGRTLEPTQIGSERWITLATRWFHTCGLSTDHELLCWGRNVEGQLGVGDTRDRRSPEFIVADVKALAVGHLHTCILDSSNRVLCTGKNDDGQLGRGDTNAQDQFTPVSF